MRDDPIYVACASMLANESLHEGSEDDASDSSSVVYDIDFEEHIDQLLSKHSEEHVIFRSLTLQRTCQDGTPFVLLPLPTTSTQLLIYLALNQRDARLDPWNPIPHIICAVDRTQTHDNIFLCLKHLVPFNALLFRTVANWVDMFRQLLEGLTFLHEHGVVHGGLSTAAQTQHQGVPGIMVDISADTNAIESPEKFDRTRYPVRYYFVDLPRARHTRLQSPLPSSSQAHNLTRPNSPSISSRSPFIDDINAFGHLLSSLLPNLPSSPFRHKLVSLSRSMVKGTLRTAEEARKLFEVMVGTVDGRILEQGCAGKVEVFPVEDPCEDSKLVHLDNVQDIRGQKPRLQPRRPSLPFGHAHTDDGTNGCGRAEKKGIRSAPSTRQNSVQWTQSCTRVSEDHPALGLVGLGLAVGLNDAWGDEESIRPAFKPELTRKKLKHAHHPSLATKEFTR
ncbi:hypothetical protein E1B28_012545 [Marasmius oreades]|uniref:Protein kinase domain-containing protein n=1 Tax=Marasmius oreades TaxID=181124 RepID=A0A9P7UP31_9AGAR|nr:uncharacterized protein E1B28_012545 [Marasmius oreades]KAG7088565.1 hypothetical protein E1B28_012545 [Marasmius oreades]